MQNLYVAKYENYNWKSVQGIGQYSKQSREELEGVGQPFIYTNINTDS
jgi:hypothetical protein